jgi:YegS/Rv2252/BmrU family lipid kinase
MKYCFIINPAAGKGKRAAELASEIDRVCKERGVEYEIYNTKAPRDAEEYIRRTVSECNGEVSFFACGGDGTLCEVVTGIMSLEDREGISLGLIPIGTGNDFARNFAPSEQYFDIGAQIDGTPYKVDLIKAADRHAINMVNIGFDCEVVCKTASIKKSPLVPSKLAYIFGLIATLVRKPGVKADISINGGEPVREELLLTTFANGAYCGGGFYSNPLASLSDGRLDSLLVSNITRLKFISLVGDYKKGTHLSEKFKKIIRNEKCEEIRLAFEKHTNVCVDGEIINVKELVLSVLHGAITFRVPKGALPIAEHFAVKEMATV